MKTRIYVDLFIPDEQVKNNVISGKRLIKASPHEECHPGDAHFEGFRYLTWVLDKYLGGVKPEGFEGLKVVIQQVHSEYVYPDPGGSACYIEGEHDCQIC